MRLSLRVGALAALAGVSLAALAMTGEPPAWSDAERADIVRFWSAPGRYAVAPLEDPKGPWRVRLTPEASQWLWSYNKARGLTKGPPGTVPSPASAKEQGWESWIEAKVRYDRWLAQSDANRQNGAGEPPPVPIPEACPADLAAFVGEPPPFASAVRPLVHRIRFDDDEFTYEDNVAVPVRYAYYRFAQGVRSSGTAMGSLPAGELDGLLAQAGITASEARVFRAVSLLEGGFDSVNTYDTGYVSVGCLQFASLKDGSGSLGATLLRMKTDDPVAFQNDFRRFGVDVSPTGVLRVVGPKDGEIAEGPLANAAIIDDPRLVAVFARAGRRAAYRIAQLRTARAQYFPGDVVLTLKLPDRTLSGKVSEVVRSEAGMAILMDRKVNTGNLGRLTERLAEIALANGVGRFGDLAKWELPLVQGLIYRVNALKSPALTQPPVPPGG